jgi:DNA-binding Lrp family transcriptional regulator
MGLDFWVFWGEKMVRSPKLTARQQTFLELLQELYQERKGPVHYSDVAQRLGVSPFSAYDMLKVLEKKGVASVSYALAGHSGPGRSMVVFAPTPNATLALGRSGEEQELDEEWQSVRERVLSRLRQARETSYREALTDLLARLPEAHAPLTFCTEMIGALLLNMGRVRARAGGLNPFRALSALRSGESGGLETLAGLSVGATLSAHDEAGPSLTQRLLEHTRGYQANLSRLSEEARSALVQFLEEALEALD